MKEEEVKEYLWKKFEEFIHGQTVGMNDDGTIDYYTWDVERFV